MGSTPPAAFAGLVEELADGMRSDGVDGVVLAGV
jgi:hypothetical protein